VTLLCKTKGEAGKYNFVFGQSKIRSLVTLEDRNWYRRTTSNIYYTGQLSCPGFALSFISDVTSLDVSWPS
jgi:hypothetical protein